MYSWYLPDVLNIPQCTHDIPLDVLMVSPRCTHGIPDVLNIPQCTHYIPPMYSLYPPMTHRIPRCTHCIPPMYSWYPRCTEIPQCTHDIPRCTHGIPRCTEHTIYGVMIFRGPNLVVS